MNATEPVKRYECTNGGTQFCQGCYQMTADEDGEYVKHEDFAALSKHNEALKAALDEALEYFEDREDVRDGPSGEQLPNTEMSMAQALRAALALSRGGGT